MDSIANVLEQDTNALLAPQRRRVERQEGVRMAVYAITVHSVRHRVQSVYGEFIDTRPHSHLLLNPETLRGQQRT